jgi:hypothetical protein
MKQQEIDSIKHLIMSQDINDVELGIIIAKKQKLSIKYIDKWTDERFQLYKETNSNINWNDHLMNLFERYVTINKEHYISWKRGRIKNDT